MMGVSEMLLVSAAEMRKLDTTVQGLGVPALVLMENAGRALAEHAHNVFMQTAGGAEIPGDMGHMGLKRNAQHDGRPKIAVLAGQGQNGGDGFCAARHLAARGYDVRVGFFGDKKRLPKEAFCNYQMLKGYPVKIYHSGSMLPHEVLENLGSPGLIIDALLGIGGKGNPRFPMDMAIEWANAQHAYVVACDIPSGVSADTGYAYSPCVKADLTVTMGFAKVGLLSYPGRMYSGKIIVETLGFPPGLVRGAGREGTESHLVSVARVTPGHDTGNAEANDILENQTEILTEAAGFEKARQLLPVRRSDHHKGLSGHVLVVAGSLGMAGAAALAAKSALRSGAGTVTLLCPGNIYHVCASMVPEVMVVPFGNSDVFCLSQGSIATLENNLERASAVVLGPGWGRGHFQTEFLKEILPLASKKTCVVDADALFALKQLGGLPYLAKTGGRFILTPHPGELALLTGISIDELQNNRPGYARAASRKSQSVMCLKGAGTCTANPSGRLAINTSGGPCMATAGSGDVLTGVIAALAAQGLSPYTCTWVGAFWHGLSGEVALRRKGSYGILADDIIECLPEARLKIEQQTQI